jgi:hypothetical protein
MVCIKQIIAECHSSGKTHEETMHEIKKARSYYCPYCLEQSVEARNGQYAFRRFNKCKPHHDLFQQKLCPCGKRWAYCLDCKDFRAGGAYCPTCKCCYGAASCKCAGGLLLAAATAPTVQVAAPAAATITAPAATPPAALAATSAATPAALLTAMQSAVLMANQMMVVPAGY